MDRSAIILAGGSSSRFGQEKGLLLLKNKPLVNHVLDAIGPLVDERVVIASSKVQAENYAKTVGSDVKVSVDVKDLHSPLVGALTGFKMVHGEYSVLLPCDTPLVSRDAVALMFELCLNKAAVIPRWPNGYMEPLQAIYHTKSALGAANVALEGKELNMRSMVDRLRGVRYVSTLVLQQLDPELATFFNINTLLDFRKAELMLKRKNQ